MIYIFKSIGRKVISYYLKNIDASPARYIHPYYKFVDLPNKKFFDKAYDNATKITDTPISLWRKDRFLNLFNLANKVAGLAGAIAECGVWKGLSSIIICSSQKINNPQYRGENFFVFDSFQGLSQPTEKDELKGLKSKKGSFKYDRADYLRNLKDFPLVTAYEGWIPEVFNKTEDRMYKLVHIDVDLLEPTLASIKYFQNRMVRGGIIVFDDYGGEVWAGMRKALTKYIEDNNLNHILFSTGQLAVFF